MAVGFPNVGRPQEELAGGHFHMSATPLVAGFGSPAGCNWASSALCAPPPSLAATSTMSAVGASSQRDRGGGGMTSTSEVRGPTRCLPPSHPLGTMASAPTLAATVTAPVPAPAAVVGGGRSFAGTSPLHSNPPLPARHHPKVSSPGALLRPHQSTSYQHPRRSIPHVQPRPIHDRHRGVGGMCTGLPPFPLARRCPPQPTLLQRPAVMGGNPVGLKRGRPHSYILTYLLVFVEGEVFRRRHQTGHRVGAEGRASSGRRRHPHRLHYILECRDGRTSETAPA